MSYLEWRALAISGDGSRVAACASQNPIYTYTYGTINNPSAPCLLALFVWQNSTGGHKVTWDSNVMGNMDISTSAGAGTFLLFLYDGINFYQVINPIAPSVTPTISTGTAAPTTIPSKAGDIYIDTTNGKIYMAKGISTSSDWLLVS